MFSAFKNNKEIISILLECGRITLFSLFKIGMIMLYTWVGTPSVI